MEIPDPPSSRCIAKYFSQIFLPFLPTTRVWWFQENLATGADCLFFSRVLISCVLDIQPLPTWRAGFMGPVLRRALCLVPCSALTILKLLKTSEKGACHISFALGSTNSEAGPACLFGVHFTSLLPKRILWQENFVYQIYVRGLYWKCMKKGHYRWSVAMS